MRQNRPFWRGSGLLSSYNLIGRLAVASHGFPPGSRHTLHCSPEYMQHAMTNECSCHKSEIRKSSTGHGSSPRSASPHELVPKWRRVLWPDTISDRTCGESKVSQQCWRSAGAQQEYAWAACDDRQGVWSLKIGCRSAILFGTKRLDGVDGGCSAMVTRVIIVKNGARQSLRRTGFS